ncbi:MAG: flagellar brake protein [Bacillota bacterium]|nr:flagellar brake protein [Bacillota bacterium]
MTLSDIKPGSKLELEMINTIGERIGPVLVSEFEWVEDDETAAIAAPIYEGVIYPMHSGTAANIYFIYGIDLYTCLISVTDRYIKDNIPILKIKKTSEITRIQRRQFFRFECSTQVKYRVVEEEDSKKNEEIPFVDSFTRDLSGGGICFACEDKLDKGTLIEFKLSLNQKKTVGFYGRIVRVDQRSSEEKYRYDIAITFSKIENVVREEIIKLIFLEQRKLRKKGLI